MNPPPSSEDTDLVKKAIADIVAFSSSHPKEDRYSPPVDRVLAGQPNQRILTYYADPSGVFSSGIWDGERGKWRVNYTEHEYCHMLAGEVELTDLHGDARRFGPGDSFVVPAGFEGTWENLSPARKLFVIYEPKKS